MLKSIEQRSGRMTSRTAGLMNYTVYSSTRLVTTESDTAVINNTGD